MKFFSIAGWSDSGKTTLISRLTEKFKVKNKRIAAVKNIPHKYHLQSKKKDSFKFLASGCLEAFLVARNEIVSMQRNDKKDKIFEILESKADNFDYILLEGLFRDDIPVIEVFDSQKNEAPKMSFKSLCALVTDKKNIDNINIPVFDFDDIDGVVQFMEDYHG
ncbi:MAG: molybdopterin-guanine dinucleotide biosynthesis protein B [Candidatus Aminicenantes bacterium]|nr:molybdopterin-guanine dinucleotide biosynthesis protein B [Candidatus Aminicenantes bacterium]